MTCHTCNEEVTKVVACKHLKKQGLCCTKCDDPGEWRSNLLHMKAGNPHAPKMTYARSMHFKSRTIGADGKAHPDPRWR